MDILDWYNQQVEMLGRVATFAESYEMIPSQNPNRVVFVESSAWDSPRPMIAPLCQNERGAYGLVAMFYRRTNQGFEFLLQAKSEPGSCLPGGVTITSTIQSSYDNLSRRDNPFLSLLSQPILERVITLVQDPGMLFYKNNDVLSVDVTTFSEAIFLHALMPYRWSTLDDLRELTRMGLVSEMVAQSIYPLFLEGVV